MMPPAARGRAVKGNQVEPRDKVRHMGRTVPGMRQAIAWLVLLLIAACGGGGEKAAVVASPDSAPTIRFEGVYDAGATRTLTIRPAAGAATIGSNPLARIDLRVNDQLTLSLAAPNGTRAPGAEYVFEIPPLFPGESNPNACTSDFPLRITAVDATGFSFTKWVTICQARSQTFSAFSDYGTQEVRITASTSAPMNLSAQRQQDGGNYRDDVVRRLATSFDAVLRSSERDLLRASIGRFVVDSAGVPVVPDGSTMTMRVDASGGAFAEAASIVASDPGGYGQSADAFLACCHAVGDGSPRQVRIIITGTSSGSPATFSTSWRIIDPVTGMVVAQASATRVGVPSDPFGATLARLEQVLDLRSGQQVEVTATTDDKQTRVDTSVLAGATTGLLLGSAGGNRRTQVSVFCCSLYASP